jgi:hypothetical protein
MVENKRFLFLSPLSRKMVSAFVENLNPPKNATSALIRFFINKHTIGKTTLSVTAGPRE